MNNSELFLKQNHTPNTADHSIPSVLPESNQNTASSSHSLELLRVLAAGLVVLTHTSAQWLDASCQAGLAALLFTQLCSIVSFCGVTIFVMLSGAIYLSPEHRVKSTSMRNMLARAIRFFLLYLIWKLFYLAEDLFLHPENLQDGGIKEQLVLAFFRTNGKYHLWYLPMFSLLLLLVPLIYEGAQRRGARLVYLTVFILAAVILPTAFLYEFPFKYLLMDAKNLFDLNHFLGYLGYFLLGHTLYQFAGSGKSAGHSRLLLLLLWISALLSLGVALWTAASRSIGQTAACSSFATPFAGNTLLLASAIFLTIVLRRTSVPFIAPQKDAKNVSSARSGVPEETAGCASKSLRFLHTLSSLTFGVYLLHPFVLDLIQQTGLLAKLTNPLVGIPILWFLLTMISAALAKLLNLLWNH